MKIIKKIFVFSIIIFLSFANAGFTASEIHENKELRRPPAFQLDGMKYREGEIIVKFKNDVKPFRTIKVPQNIAVKEALETYLQRFDVEYAEPDYIASAFFVPNDPYLHLQWNFDNYAGSGINAKAAWDISTGTNVVVAVVDTGIAYEDYVDGAKSYYKAPDLASTCIVPGFDFINNDSHPNDDNSHGTHVAGTVAQSTNNSIGVAGIAHGACLMPVKVLDSNGNGAYSAVASGIRFAADNGAKVINLSLGGSASSQTLVNAIQYAYSKGVTIVAAAGNDGASAISYPAAYNDYVIAVGATRYDTQKAPYSNYGAGLDVMAPGGDTTVDQNGDGYVDGILQNTFNPNTKNRKDFGYWFFQGTSMATPHVAGVAALVISKGSAVTPVDVRNAIETTARDLGAQGWDSTYGWGLVDANAAVQYSPIPLDLAPNVSITNPLNNARVSGSILITAQASDDNSTPQVEFYLDQTLIETDMATPYEALLDTVAISEGNHTITAKAIDSINQSLSATISVLVDNVNDIPVASAGSDISAYTGDSVAFNGSASYDPDGTIASYTWDFGDFTQGVGANATHAYSQAGTYTATLTVTDDRGGVSSDSAIITINDKPLIIKAFSDSFEISQWNGLWTGDKKWKRSSRRASDGLFSAEVKGRAADSVLRSIPISLQGKTNSTITFSWFISSTLDFGEYVAFDVSSDNGVTWTEKAKLRGDQDPENSWRNVSVSLSGISNLQIRFRGLMSIDNEIANVDNVIVNAL